MVDWISEIGEELKLQPVTIHSAISFLDQVRCCALMAHGSGVLVVATDKHRRVADLVLFAVRTFQRRPLTAAHEAIYISCMP
jgi:hypothetical protein